MALGRGIEKGDTRKWTVPILVSEGKCGQRMAVSGVLTEKDDDSLLVASVLKGGFYMEGTMW